MRLNLQNQWFEQHHFGQNQVLLFVELVVRVPCPQTRGSVDRKRTCKRVRETTPFSGRGPRPRGVRKRVVFTMIFFFGAAAFISVRCAFREMRWRMCSSLRTQARLAQTDASARIRCQRSRLERCTCAVYIQMEETRPKTRPQSHGKRPQIDL